MKNQKGISLIALIITLAVIIILAGFTIFEGLSSVNKKAEKTKTIYEVSELIDAVTNRGLLYRLNPNYYTYVGKNSFDPIRIGKAGQQETYTGNGDWYLISEQEHFAELGLDNVEGVYLVNYKNGSVISIDGVEYEDELYYSLNDLKREMGGGQTILADMTYNTEKGVNEPVLSEGMVPVKLKNEKWVVTDASDTEWYDYSLDQMAWANIMLKDELTVQGYTNEQVRNASLEELAGKEVTKEGSTYVWIPRYSASSLTEGESDIIFSNLTNDTTSAYGETYSVPSAFTYVGEEETIELPGIWVSKYEASFSN